MSITSITVIWIIPIEIVFVVREDSACSQSHSDIIRQSRTAVYALQNVSLCAKIRISESKSKLACILPSVSIFGEAKDMNKQEQKANKIRKIDKAEYLQSQRSAIRISEGKMQILFAFCRGEVSSAEGQQYE